MSETTFKVGDEVTYMVVRSSGSSVEMNTRRGKIRAFGESGRCALVQLANGRKQWLALSRLRAGGARTELTETVESMFSADDEAHRERRLRSLERYLCTLTRCNSTKHMTRYNVTYDFVTLATVEIDEEAARYPIREMVEFWMDWEAGVESNGGDYAKTWLKNLGRFILNRGRLPEGDEGWCPLDGSAGIRVIEWQRWAPDIDDIEVTNADAE